MSKGSVRFVRCCLLISSLLTIGAVVASQERAPAAAQPNAEGKSVVYVWKTWHPSTLGRAAYDVFLDERPIAKLDRNRYFVALVTPGRHIFRTKTREVGEVVLDCVPGGRYYLRMDTSNGMLVGRPVLSHVSEQEGQAAVRQAKPLKADDVRDRSIVVMNYDQLALPAAAPLPAAVTSPTTATSSTSASIRVTSEPDGAEIFVDGKFAGSTPSTLIVAVGDHVLKVTRPGFADWERTVAIEAGSAKTFNALLVR